MITKKLEKQILISINIIIAVFFMASVGQIILMQNYINNKQQYMANNSIDCITSIPTPPNNSLIIGRK